MACPSRKSKWVLMVMVVTDEVYDSKPVVVNAILFVSFSIPLNHNLLIRMI